MGIEIDEDTYLYTLQFADDQVLYANDKKDLQYMTRKLIEEYSYWRLSMNVDKTKYLCIGEERTDIESNQEKIESCRRYKYLQYKYLGVLFNTQGTDEGEIKLRNIQARRAECLNGAKRLEKKRKVQI